jgi:vacuolar protein sorting-associated protein 54
MIIGLRGVIIRQASIYLSKLHQGSVEKCARVLLDETWSQVEVGAEVQGVVDVLVSCAMKDAAELKVDSEGAVFGSANPGSAVNGAGVNGKDHGVLSSSSPTPAPKSPTLRNLPPTKTFAGLSETGAIPTSDSKESTKSGGSGKGNAKHLRIEDRSYYIVPATAEILVLLIDYLKIVINLRYSDFFPSRCFRVIDYDLGHGSTLTKDTINKVVEFLMTFNSRTCQLVLGAGATKSAGLKHITAKHLGSSSFYLPPNYIPKSSSACVRGISLVGNMYHISIHMFTPTFSLRHTAK